MKYSKVKIIWISVLQCRANSCIEQINLFNYLEVPLVTRLKDWTWPVHYQKLYMLSLSQSKEEVSSTSNFFSSNIISTSFQERKSLYTQWLICYFVRMNFSLKVSDLLTLIALASLPWMGGLLNHVLLIRLVVMSDVYSSDWWHWLPLNMSNTAAFH